jgi:type IV secretory pathway VirB4 component
MALNARSSQDFVPIKEVKNGIIILKDGSLRAILLVSSINLSLKSEEEQVAIIRQFQSFLNGLDFPIQIVMQSRRLDIRPYLMQLEERLKIQTEQLLKIQTKEYIDFIRSFTDEVNIMTKTFFIVVPYASNVLSGAEGIVDKIMSNGSSKNQILDSKRTAELTSFEEKRTQIDQRINEIMGGLSGIGIRSTQLKTDEVIELFYKTFNPGDISQGIKLQ